MKYFLDVYNIHLFDKEEKRDYVHVALIIAHMYACPVWSDLLQSNCVLIMIRIGTLLP